jgi:ATP-dependent exoDNAse (exonuclease V) beta subunit
MKDRDFLRLESPEVVVVEASAGSGKTYCLAKRYLQLLINPRVKLEQVPLRNILAITFTNKATIEMKERILGLLKRMALDAFETPEEESDIFQMLGVDKEIAARKACLIMDELIRHYSFFQVQTIDSFINALLLGSALDIGRSSHFKIKRDYDRYLTYCLDLVIDQAVTDKEVLKFFEEFLEHYLFVQNRSSWFPKRDILGLLKSLFTLSNKYGGSFRTYQGESRSVIKKKAILFGAIKKLASGFPSEINATSKNSILKFIESQGPTFDIRKVPGSFKSSNVPMRKGFQAPEKFTRQWRRIEKGLRDLCKLDATVFFNPYVKLFQKMTEFLQFVSRREDFLFLEELNYKARSLFRDGVTVAELYYRLATRFNHYLIDEFQDTSLLQWRNLEIMIDDALASGGSLFYVGDKKQAIYRFRGGQAGLFDKVRDEFGRYNVKKRFLTKNWRSQKEIVEFNNLVFSQKNLKRALSQMGLQKEAGLQESSIERILKVFKDSKQEYDSRNTYGYVIVERIDAEAEEERDRIVKDKLLSLIGELNKDRGFALKDIAVLCRDNDEVERVSSWLLEENVPVESDKTLDVLKNPLVKEITCLLRFLHSPIDDLSFACFLLGEVFRLATGLSLDEVGDFLFRLHKDKEKIAEVSLYRHFRQRYPEIWKMFFEEFLRSVGFVSPYELLVSIYERFRVLVNFGDEQAFFMKFLELIKLKEDECAGLGELLDYLDTAPKEDLYVTVTETDSVCVLTIHKSKGLEFGAVIIPFLRLDIVPETGGKGTGSYVTKFDDGALGLVRITKGHRGYACFLDDIYKDAYVEACIDELNSLYVALTRAKFELYIFIPLKLGRSQNKAHYLIPEEIRQRGNPRAYRYEEKTRRPIFQIPASRYQDWLKFLKDEFEEEANLKNRDRIIQGNFAHYALSCIENLYGKDKKTEIKRAIEMARILYPYFKDTSGVAEKITALIDKKEVRPLFYVSDGRVYREKEVVDSSGDTKRIDRLIVKEKQILIVDFKSSREGQEIHQRQMKEYIRIIKDMYPESIVKGFLIYLDELALDKVNGEGNHL